MRTGVTLFAQNYSDWDRYEAGDWDGDPKISDAQIYEEEIALGDLVEPLGFDSLWTVEHHFTPYTMDTNTLQFLTFFAGRTKKLDMGTMVIVLPWHDPVRVAEEAAMLDNFLQGRKLSLGFGRGAAKVEYDGFRVDMNSSRERFLEALEVVRKALSSKHFSHEGKYFQIPEINLRPRPRSNLLENMHMAWGSPTSVPIAAQNGLLPLVIPQKQWHTHVAEMQEYNNIRMGMGYSPGQPVVLLAVYVHEDPEIAERVGRYHVTQYADSARRHYKFDDMSHLADVKGYDYYNDLAKQFAEERKDVIQHRIDALNRRVEAGENAGKVMMDQFTNSHVWGTPESVLEQIKERMVGVGGKEFVGVFKYGDMSYETAEANLKLFAQKVLPGLKAMPTPAPLLAQAAAAAT